MAPASLNQPFLVPYFQKEASGQPPSSPAHSPTPEYTVPQSGPHFAYHLTLTLLTAWSQMDVLIPGTNSLVL